MGILIPFFRSVNSDVNMTLAIAIVSFVFVEMWGIRTLGIGYLGKFFAFKSLAKGPLGGIDVFVGFLELISEFVRIVSFTFRLFGNIFAGEVLILMMSYLVPFLFVLPFYFLEIFVGFIQAAVFAILTLVFAAMAVESHAEHEEQAEHGEAVAAPAH
jgi:F-type H+-transporting ATPase subunit a